MCFHFQNVKGFMANMDNADITEESAEDITAADTEPSPKKAEIKGQIIYLFSQLVSTFTLELLQLNKCKTDPYFLQNFQCTTMFGL